MVWHCPFCPFLLSLWHTRPGVQHPANTADVDKAGHIIVFLCLMSHNPIDRWPFRGRRQQIKPCFSSCILLFSLCGITFYLVIIYLSNWLLTAASFWSLSFQPMKLYLILLPVIVKKKIQHYSVYCMDNFVIGE